MEPRPLPELPAYDSGPPEPRLELLADPEETSAEHDESAEEPVSATEDDDDQRLGRAKAEPTQDPLKLYVRAIGDGRLLTAVEERELAKRKEFLARTGEPNHACRDCFGPTAAPQGRTVAER